MTNMDPQEQPADEELNEKQLENVAGGVEYWDPFL